MTQVLISKELATLKVGEKLLIPKEQYDEIMRDIELEYQIELANEICLAEEAQMDAEFKRNIESLEAEEIAEQAQIDAWHKYIDDLYEGKYDEYIDVTPVKEFPIEEKPDSFSITEKEIFIEEV